MARALECPACGHRHRLETIPSSGTFRCEQCGQVLKVPAAVSSEPGAPPPPHAAPATATRTGAPAPVAPPARRTQNAPAADGATRGAPVRTAAAVSATVAATASPSDTNGSGARIRSPVEAVADGARAGYGEAGEGPLVLAASWPGSWPSRSGSS